MYKVEIYKTIWADELPGEGGAAPQMKYLSAPYPECVAFRYTINLPFPPFVGLTITEDNNHYFNSGSIKEITWFSTENMFVCQVEHVFPFSHGGYDYDFNYLLEECKREGWQIVESEDP